jgi:hypothetical protein
VIADAYLAGVSTRRVEKLVQQPPRGGRMPRLVEREVARRAWRDDDARARRVRRYRGRHAAEQRGRHASASARAQHDQRGSLLGANCNHALRRVPDRSTSPNRWVDPRLLCKMHKQRLGIAQLFVTETPLTGASGAHARRLRGRADMQEHEFEPEALREYVRVRECLTGAVGIVETTDYGAHLYAIPVLAGVANGLVVCDDSQLAGSASESPNAHIGDARA